jgi:uncharacterized protein YeaO (DUF488 family)
MKIFTSYYANIKNIPRGYFLVSASGGIADGIKDTIDVWDKTLAPSWSIYKEYKEGNDTALYTRRFAAEILPKIDWKQKLKTWASWYGEDANIVILCYEKPGEFCHRHLLAQDIKEKLNIDVEELANLQSIKPLFE